MKCTIVLDDEGEVEEGTLNITASFEPPLKTGDDEAVTVVEHAACLMLASVKAFGDK